MDEADGNPGIAVALRYSRDLPAPIVTARAAGRVAARLVALARRVGIPVQRDPDTARALEAVAVDSLIPAQVYESVARILVAVHRAEQQ